MSNVIFGLCFDVILSLLDLGLCFDVILLMLDFGLCFDVILSLLDTVHRSTPYIQRSGGSKAWCVT